jgi:probable rRNA maturation factor
VLKIEINVEHGKWKKSIPKFDIYIRQAIKKTFKILLTSSKEIKKLNNKYRKINKMTNVLAFPMDNEPLKNREILGDIAISLEAIIVEAKKYKISRRKYLSKMVIHGLLHLLGYDHIKDNDFHIMSKIEKEVFRKIV